MASVRKSVLYSVAGYAVWSACSFLLFSMLTKITDLETSGLYQYAIALVTPITDFAALNLRSLQNTDAKADYHTSTYMALRWLAMSLAMVVIAGLGFALGQTTLTVICLVLFAVRAGIEWLDDVFHGLFQSLDRMDLVARSLVVRSVLGLVIFGVTLAVTRSLVMAMVAHVLVTAAVYVWDHATARRLSAAPNLTDAQQRSLARGIAPVFAWLDMRRLAWLALPLAITVYLVSANTMAPRYAVEQVLGKEALGIFAAYAYIVVIGRLGIIATGVALSTPLAQAYQAGDRRRYLTLFGKMIAISAALLVIMPLVGMLAGAPLIRLLYTEEYTRDLPVLTLVLFGGALGYVGNLCGYGMTSMRILRPQVPVYAVTLAVTVFLAWQWVPAHKLEGAAWAMIVGNAVQAVLSALVCAYGLARIPPGGTVVS